ncbi:MAG: OmpA family protein [Bacteroidales bacterium]|jgi:outer membrane protein OmpA-like peptidoglycan-associated protein|nr:OmpA family protein [Bacteroidales bacterium]
MKRISLVIILLSSLIAVSGQNNSSDRALSKDTTSVKKERKGAHYLSVGVGVSPNGFSYKLKGLTSDGSRRMRLNGNAIVGYSYFFNKHWGIGTGVGFAHFRTVGVYKKDFSDDEYVSLGNQTDDDNAAGVPVDYELRVRLGNWKERQTANAIEVPLLVQFQHKFGLKQKFGLYFNVGAKVQIPFGAKYKVLDGNYENDARLNVSGYYPEAGMDLGSPSNPPLAYHGFGSIHNPNEKWAWNNDLKLKVSIAGTAEFGFLFAVARRVDLTLGAYIDYGFNNVIKKTDKPLLEASADYFDGETPDIGKNIQYNGMLTSDRVSKARLVSYGGKIGIRIRLGRVEKTPWEKQQEEALLAKTEDSLFRENQKEYNDAILAAVKDLQKGVNEIRTWKDLVNERLEKPAKEKEVIPEKVQEISEEEHTTLSGHVYFALNSASIRSSQYALLNKKVALLKKYPHLHIQVIGNTCDLGSGKFNSNLGLSRATSVRDYLISKGIDAKRIEVSTRSYNDPLLPNTTEDNRAQNRRCDFEILSNK